MDYSIDQQHDYSNKELYTYLSGVELPGYVKEAELDSVVPQNLEKSAFADSTGCLFPINTKANVFISNAFLVNKQASLGKVKGDLYVKRVQERIKQAADIFGVAEELNAYNKHVVEKSAEDYQDRTISVILDGDSVDLFSIKTAAQLIDGADNFVRDIDRFPFEWRSSISQQFVKAAEDLGLEEIPDIIAKYAGLFFPDIVQVKEEILRRSTKLAGEAKESYTKLAEDVENIEGLDEVFKLAEICYKTEKAAGLYDSKYNKKVLGNPVDRFFTLSLDKVAELMDTVTMAGEKYATADLAAVPQSVYEEAFGFELDVKSAEAQDVLPTLPKADVELFKKISGVSPI